MAWTSPSGDGPNKREYCVGCFPARCLEEVMSEKIYDVPPEWKKLAYVDADKYKEMYARSVKDPNGFWAEQAKRLHWYKAPTKIKNSSFGPGNVSIKWFEDGVLNAAYNCIDRHLSKRANQTAIIWEGDDPRGGLRHARLRAHRRDSFGGVRRFLAGLARRSHLGLQIQRRHHRRRG